MDYRPEEIANIVGGSYHTAKGKSYPINRVVIDSRANLTDRHSMFVALRGAMTDGHHFLWQFAQKGGTLAIVSDEKYMLKVPELHYILVSDTLDSLQQLAIYHRRRFKDLKVIAITGSNGKTIVKEWLSTLLPENAPFVKTIGSYNSQIGVALSVLQIKAVHKIGIFEAGISTIGEMSNLEAMIQPSVGIFTNLGSAHDTGFENRDQKFLEKIQLFKNCAWVISSSVNSNWFEKYKSSINFKLIQWSLQKSDQGLFDYEVLIDKKKKLDIKIPFKDSVSIQNLVNAITCIYSLGLDIEKINEKYPALPAVEMRLEIRQGPDGSLIINDSYINDRESLEAAMEFMNIHAGGRKKILVVSDFVQSYVDNAEMQEFLLSLNEKYQLEKMIWYGDKLQKNNTITNKNIFHCSTKEELSIVFKNLDLKNSIILFKTSRKYTLDSFVKTLYNQKNSATLSINLSALDHNVSQLSTILKPECKLMAVIKSAAYGGGIAGITDILMRRNITYLAVAQLDEGIELRKKGVDKPILIFNPNIHQLNDMIIWQLEPEVFSVEMLEYISKSIGDKHINVHLKIDTGMHRLGILWHEIDACESLLKNLQNIKIVSVFSHLSASDTPEADDYTTLQAQRFEDAYQKISSWLNYQPIRHILNTDGILRFPQYQFEMVRVGIGLYGIAQSLSEKLISDHISLRKVHSLRASILQIKNAEKDVPISYGAQYRLSKKSTLAVINIGYADGVPRSLSNGKYSFRVKGLPAPIVGKVCMDTTIIDITHIENVTLNDEVVIFDELHTIENMSNACDTIPYEILCRISQRISREYIRD